MKRDAGRKYFQITYLNEIVPMIYKEPSKDNMNKISNPIRKWSKGINEFFTKEDT